MSIKRYMDIENIREEDENIRLATGETNSDNENTSIFRSNNVGGFAVGDLIQITEKYDGANASMETVDGVLHCYSRNKELDAMSTLNGFWNYGQHLSEEGFTIPDNWLVFGEWSGARNKIVYDKKNTWFVFDIFDKSNGVYLSHNVVKAFCEQNKLEFIHELYTGPFISWEHCRSFCHSPAYGDTQEGIVVKNETTLKALVQNKEHNEDEENSSAPFYLKIVNKEFKESVKKKPVMQDAEKDAAMAEAKAIIESIVTRNRVEKLLLKLRDEGEIPAELSAKSMGAISKLLPKRVFDDCMKEEKEKMIAAGEYAGKFSNAETMRIARELVLGK